MKDHPIHKLPVELSPYDPQWPQLFEDEVARLRPIFRNNLIEIHHIGSTSIPNMVAKPIIDMIPVVHNLTKIDEINSKMEKNDYICMGELGIPGRRFFCKNENVRTHNVHVFQEGDPNIARHLKFRDILRAQPGLAEEYAQLKSELCVKHRNDRKAYTDAKTDFVRKVENM